MLGHPVVGSKAQRLSVVTEAFAQGRIGMALAQDALDGCAELKFSPDHTPHFVALPVARGLPQLPSPDAQPVLMLAGPAAGQQVVQAATALLPSNVAQAFKEAVERGRANAARKARRAQAQQRLDRMVLSRRKREAAQAVATYGTKEHAA